MTTFTTFTTPADLEAAQARLADFESRLSRLAPHWIEEAFRKTVGTDLPDALAALRQAFQRIEEFESALAKSNGSLERYMRAWHKGAGGPP